MEHPLAAKFLAEANLTTGGHRFDCPILRSPRVTVLAKDCERHHQVAEGHGGASCRQAGRASGPRCGIAPSVWLRCLVPCGGLLVAARRRWWSLPGRGTFHVVGVAAKGLSEVGPALGPGFGGVDGVLRGSDHGVGPVVDLALAPAGAGHQRGQDP